MDLRYVVRNLLIALVSLVLLVLVAVLVVKGINSLKHGTNTLPAVNITSIDQTTSKTSLFINGPVDSSVDHRQLRVTVSAQDVEVDVLQGYQGSVTDKRVYGNSQAAYNAFLHGLVQYNFAKTTNRSVANDICATGSRFTFTLHDGARTRVNSWTTTCGGGTFRGATNSVLGLFQAQIPQADLPAITNESSLPFAVSSGLF